MSAIATTDRHLIASAILAATERVTKRAQAASGLVRIADVVEAYERGCYGRMEVLRKLETVR